MFKSMECDYRINQLIWYMYGQSKGMEGLEETIKSHYTNVFMHFAYKHIIDRLKIFTEKSIYEFDQALQSSLNQRVVGMCDGSWYKDMCLKERDIESTIIESIDDAVSAHIHLLKFENQNLAVEKLLKIRYSLDDATIGIMKRKN